MSGAGGRVGGGPATVPEGRGAQLLRRVLAGSGAAPAPDWAVATAVTDLTVDRPGPPDLAGPELDGPGLDAAGPLRHAVQVPARPGRPADWPLWVPPHVRD